jgi:alanyl-tRNA synthetase
LNPEKELLRKKFSSDPDRYYKVELFRKYGFIRKKCPLCEGYFWTLDEKNAHCPEQPCGEYTFLGDPPTNKRFGYTDAWNTISNYFQKNGHKKIARYPVVCRWRPDLYFTVASIVDFQRIESGKVVFEFPANPLIVPQVCPRFVDIGNVGITGRHYTSFCMVGQHALANPEGYWKDRCIELDFNLLTQEFNIPKEEIIFKEDVWVGPGAFGNSLEFYVRGLELGNAVFTAFEGNPFHYKEYEEKVIDMGAGLERFAWITQGTPTSYDSVFGKAALELQQKIGLEFNDSEKNLMFRYFKLAGTMDVEQFKTGDTAPIEILRQIGETNEQFAKKMIALRSIYSIIDHTRTLVFAISDGALPSNVGGGYNLRVILRRAFDYVASLGEGNDLGSIAEWHCNDLRVMFPELREHVEEIKTVFDAEEAKYGTTKEHSRKIIEGLVAKKSGLSSEQMIQLYDSDGITPETLQREGLKIDVPADFYTKVTERHMSQRRIDSEKESIEVLDLPPTRLLFYENRDQFKFEAKVLAIIRDQYLVLDMTAFYARSGGQEPDHGTIEGFQVVDVIKSNGVVLHQMKDLKSGIILGETVHGVVDKKRRSLIMRHHTATHIVNGASRRILGSWVWQHSAFKDEDMGKLDITHFAHLSREQVLKIERLSNEVVRQDLPVKVSFIPRNEAEQKYGFRLYQGGVVPNKELRIVNIEGWDVEACGGTHCSSTGEIGLIKITKSERVQDGVERLEFVAGEAAVDYVEHQESILNEAVSQLETGNEKLIEAIANLKSKEAMASRSTRLLARQLASVSGEEVLKSSKAIRNGLRLFVAPEPIEGLGVEYYLTVGENLTAKDPNLIYVAVFNEANKTRIMTFVGEAARLAGVKAGELTKAIAGSLGGFGGGDAKFGQGGTKQTVERLPNIEEIVRAALKQ